MRNATVLMLSALLGLLSSIGAQAKDQPKGLIVATELSFRPFAYQSRNGDLRGIDVDIALALCRHLKRICQIQDRPFEGLLDDVEERRVDMAIAALDITSERRTKVAFSNPYYRNDSVYVSLSDASPQSALNGAIGVQNGSSQMAYLIAEKKWNLIRFDTYNDAFAALRQGRISAVFADRLVATAWLERRAGRRFRMVGNRVHSLSYFGRGLGIAVSKDNLALLEQLNLGLAQLEENGELDKIIGRYLPEG